MAKKRCLLVYNVYVFLDKCSVNHNVPNPD